MGLIAGYQSSATLQPGEQALNFPTPALLPKCLPVLRRRSAANSSVRRYQDNTPLPFQLGFKFVAVVGLAVLDLPDARVLISRIPSNASRRSRGGCPLPPARGISNRGSSNSHWGSVILNSTLDHLSPSVSPHKNPIFFCAASDFLR